MLLLPQGPTYSVTVNGGECEINDDGSVECEPPSITLSSTPYICNLPYRTAAKLEVSVRVEVLDCQLSLLCTASVLPCCMGSAAPCRPPPTHRMLRTW